MSDFFEAADRVAWVAASLHDNFTQFVNGQPNHPLCSLLEEASKELKIWMAMILSEVRKPAVSIFPNHR